MATKLLARAGGASLDLLDEDAPGYVPLRDRARFGRHVAHFARRQHERTARAGHGLGAEISDLAELHVVVRTAIDTLVEREANDGAHHPGIDRLMTMATGNLALLAELRSRTRPRYWIQEVERAARRAPAPSPPASRAFPERVSLAPPPTPGSPCSAAAAVIAAPPMDLAKEVADACTRVHPSPHGGAGGQALARPDMSSGA